MFVISEIVKVTVLASSLAAGQAAIPGVLLHQATADLGQIRTIQAVAVAFDGGYAERLDYLLDGTYTFTYVPAPGSEIGYAVNSDGSHYFVGTRTDAGAVYLLSDTSPVATVCVDGVTPECVSQITGDEELLAATPEWKQF